MNTGPNIAPDQPSRRLFLLPEAAFFHFMWKNAFFEWWALPPVVFLHTAWLTKPIPEAKAEQNLLDEPPQEVGAKGLKEVPVGKTGTLQAANLYLPICVNPAPTLSIFGFVRVFPKFHMLG